VARRRARGMGLLTLALLVAACGAGGDAANDSGDRITFEDVQAPEVLDRRGMAIRDSDDGATGLWAAVPGLARPERAVAINLDTGAETEVALFSAPRQTAAIRLSHEAADQLRVTDTPVEVRIVALRRKPAIDFNQW
jgi:hypothetical protein